MADTDRGEGPTHSSYARVPRSSSTPFKEERASAKRWTAAETRARVSDAPKFRFSPPSAAVLDELVEEYQRITGDQIRTQKKRNLLAACYRVHGADVILFIADVFAVQETAQNLLGIIRFAPQGETGDQPLTGDDVGGRTDAQPVSFVLAGDLAQAPDHDGPPCSIERCLPNLIYCEHHSPPFDPTSRRRYDRRPSNPDAARYFVDQTHPSGSSATTGARGE